MSSENFANIIAEASIASPDRDALARVFEEARAGHKILTLPHLVNIAQKAAPVSVEKLALALRAIVRHGLAKRVVAVTSPRGGEIGEYGSVEEVPEEVWDPRQDCAIHVGRENLVVIYKF